MRRLWAFLSILLFAMSAVYAVTPLPFPTTLKKIPIRPRKEVYMINQIGDLEIKSPAFENKTFIPKKYTCDGEGMIPPLSFENIPEETVSLVLIMDDPDAPMGTFDHWVVFNIPPEKNGIAEKERLEGVSFGRNSAGNIEYTTPCPPPGKIHHYVFKLYALDTILDLEDGTSKKNIEKAMQGHILEQSSLVGLFKR